MKVDFQEHHGLDEADRLRCLLDAAESHAECRFALITFGPDAVVLTTSNRVVSDYERTLFACFAQAALSREAALHLGMCRGIATAANHEYGPRENGNEWPDEVVAMLEEHARRGAEASMNAADLTRIAMVPFGLAPYTDSEATIWARKAMENTEGAE
jgi:hypothetical protein